MVHFRSRVIRISISCGIIDSSRDGKIMKKLFCIFFFSTTPIIDNYFMYFLPNFVPSTRNTFFLFLPLLEISSICSTSNISIHVSANRYVPNVITVIHTARIRCPAESIEIVSLSTFKVKPHSFQLPSFVELDPSVLSCAKYLLRTPSVILKQ